MAQWLACLVLIWQGDGVLYRFAYLISACYHLTFPVSVHLASDLSVSVRLKFGLTFVSKQRGKVTKILSPSK